MALKFATMPIAVARPDNRGRITLGRKVTDGVSKYDIFLNSETGEVLLRPSPIIPPHEKWIHDDEKIKASLMTGLAQAKAGQLVSCDLSAMNWIDEIEEDE